MDERIQRGLSRPSGPSNGRTGPRTCTIAEPGRPVSEPGGPALRQRAAGVLEAIIPASGSNDVSLEDAKRWIGRRLVLRKPLLGFAAGTPCVVMCIVDFGDGPLLWITTDDERCADIDQIGLRDLQEHFYPRS